MVLARVGQLVIASIRTEDIFARYGGEEFVIACRGISVANAAVLGERLRSIVEQTEFSLPDGRRFRVTMSVGVAEHTPGNTPEQLIDAADKALYVAKRGGRNRVAVSDPD